MTRRLRNPEAVGWATLAAAIALAAALALWLQRGLTFGYDELPWLEIAALSELDQFWHPYGGHLIVVPYYVFRGVLELFGTSYGAFAAVQVVALSLMGVLLYVYAKRRLGPILALAPAILLLFLGGSYPVLLEPMIGIQFLAALLPGFAAIVLLEREDLAGDVAACALLCLALAGFSEALPFLLGAIVSVAISPNWKRRLWVVAIPILAYGYWRVWATQFGPTGVIRSNVPFLPAYFLDFLAVSGTAVFGMTGFVGPGPWSLVKVQDAGTGFVFEGIAIGLLELGLIGLAVWAARRRDAIRRSLLPPLAMFLALVVELGVILAPGRTAAEPRYLYAEVLLLLLIGIELARGVRTTRTTVAVTGALLLAALAGNAGRLGDGRDLLVDYSQHARADMAVIELAGQNGDQRLTPNQALPGVVGGAFVLNSGPWLLTVERYGSVAYSVPELRRQAEDVRVEADRVAARSLRLKLAPLPALPGRCRGTEAVAAGAGLALPAGGAVLRPSADAEVVLRRWGDRFSVDLGPLAAGQAARLRIPLDRAGDPWYAALRPSAALAICPLG